MAYTSINKPTDYFNTVLYTGDGNNARTVTGVGFQPNFVWLKGRSEAEHHTLNDSVRGANKQLYSHLSYGEATDTDRLQSFDSDGFTLGTDVIVNKSSQTFVSWNWLAGGTAVSNTDGNITTTVSANTTAGFSILSYTSQIGTSGSNYTLGHGLSSTPEFFIAKSRSAENWGVYYTANGVNTNFIQLNSTNAQGTNNSGGGLSGNAYATFSASTINIAYDSWANSGNNGHTMIGYAFHSVKGFSKFGSYTGNGDSSGNGPFIHTGFKPAWIMIKNASTGSSYWLMVDNKRDTFNVTTKKLYANISNGEFDDTHYNFDFLSNGFKLKSTSTTTNYNNSGDTYIYMAFAEHPFVSSTGTPTTAR